MIQIKNIPYGHENAVQRPSNPIEDRRLRSKIEKANRDADCIINVGNEAIVNCAILQCMRGVRIEKPVHMKYRWYEKNKRRDKDNISSYGRKVIQDSLVYSHVLKNDGWKEITGFSDEFFVDADNPRIEVLIREVGDDG